MAPIRKSPAAAGDASIMAVLLDYLDAEFLPECWNEDGPTPVRRYGLTGFSLVAKRRSPVHRRHGLCLREVTITDAGAACLHDDLESDALGRAAGLPPGEFLGLQLGRWVAPRSSQQGMVLFREMQFLRYRIERTRRAGNPAVQAALQGLLAELRERYRPYAEVVVRDTLKRTVH